MENGLREAQKLPNRYYHISRSQGNLSEFFSFTIGVVGGTFLEVIAQIYSKGDNCSICGPVSFFVRGVIWHWAELYNCSWLPNQMISLVLLFGFLCRSSSWWPWPHIGGGRLFWLLLRPQMALLGHFFCKIYFLWVWRRKAFFGGSCRSLFLSLGRYFVGPLNG